MRCRTNCVSYLRNNTQQLKRPKKTGNTSLVLYDVSTLLGRHRPNSKEWRLEPQITIGLLTGADGFPLMLSAFEGNRAETKTMLPVIEKFIAAHRLPDVTVVAVTRFIEERTGWSIKKFVRTARRHRTIQIQAGHHTLTAEDPLPPDLRDALDLIKQSNAGFPRT